MSLLHPNRALTRKEFEDHKTVIPIDHPDESVTRTKLEYPTVDVTIGYLIAINKLELNYRYGYPIITTIDSWADRRLEGVASGGSYWMDGGFYLRFVDDKNWYFNRLYIPDASSDNAILKCVAGTETRLAYEPVDLTDHRANSLAFETIGTTLNNYRGTDALPTTVTVSATDTTFASGKAGICNIRPAESAVWLKLPASRMPRVIAYFEVPITGTGKPYDPFTAQMPYEERIDPILGKRNLLALSHSALIPTGSGGQPLHGTALVRVFEQPDRDPALRDVPVCLDVLRAMAGVREMTRDEAIRRAKEMDDKLTDFDLIRFSKTDAERVAKEFIRWRRDAYKVEITEEEAIRVLISEKGW